MGLLRRRPKLKRHPDLKVELLLLQLRAGVKTVDSKTWQRRILVEELARAYSKATDSAAAAGSTTLEPINKQIDRLKADIETVDQTLGDELERVIGLSDELPDGVDTSFVFPQK